MNCVALSWLNKELQYNSYLVQISRQNSPIAVLPHSADRHSLACNQVGRRVLGHSIPASLSLSLQCFFPLKQIETNICSDKCSCSPFLSYLLSPRELLLSFHPSNLHLPLSVPRFSSPPHSSFSASVFIRSGLSTYEMALLSAPKKKRRKRSTGQNR